MADLNQVIEGCDKAATEAQKYLDLVAQMPMVIDEVAVYFEKPEQLDFFVFWCKRQGWTNFNSVPIDLMVQEYGNSMERVRNVCGPAFEVRFEFLSHPDRSWRIEAMCIHDGWAPLHRRQKTGDVIHVSGKAKANTVFNAETEYGRMKLALRERFPLMAEYSNSYGRFSYFGAGAPYFKPRVNLRD